MRNKSWNSRFRMWLEMCYLFNTSALVAWKSATDIKEIEIKTNCLGVVEQFAGSLNRLCIGWRIEATRTNMKANPNQLKCSNKDRWEMLDVLADYLFCVHRLHQQKNVTFKLSVRANRMSFGASSSESHPYLSPNLYVAPLMSHLIRNTSLRIMHKKKMYCNSATYRRK